MKTKVLKRIFLLSFALIPILLSGCGHKKEEQETRVLFSWKKSAILKERTNLFSIMKEIGLNTLYQYVSEDIDDDFVIKFLEESEKEQVAIYLLSGEPSWVLEDDGESFLTPIDQVISLNQKLEKKQAIKGVVYDVEPYLLQEWDTSEYHNIMKNYVNAMQTVYEKAKEGGLQVVLCIPYFYDDKDASEYLELLIQSCDSIAIMNYYRGKEIENIRFEVDLASKYGKQVLNIYELKAPGEHGLKEINTYHELGIKAAEENFTILKATFRKSTNISFALHDFVALKEMMGYE